MSFYDSSVAAQTGGVDPLPTPSPHIHTSVPRTKFPIFHKIFLPVFTAT